MRFRGNPADLGRKVRVLIVEDEDIVAAEIDRCLKRQGYERCGRATTGEEAVPLAERILPDVVLMDLKLGGTWDGLETASQLLSKIQVPVVFMSAHADIATVQRARAISPLGFLLKPFASEELGAVLEQALQRFSLEWQRNLFAATLDACSEAVAILAVTPSAPQLEFVNRRFLQIAGKDPQSLLGLDLPASLGLAAESPGAEALRQALAHPGSESHSVRVQRPPLTNDGGGQSLEVTCLPANDAMGRRRHWIILVVENAAAAGSLTEQLRVQSALIDHVGEAVYVTNPEHVITFWSRGAERLYGWTTEEAVGTPIQSLIFRQHPEKLEDIRSALENGDEWSGECQHVTKAGTSLPIESRTCLLPATAGGSAAILAVNSDLSDKRNTEIRLRRAQQLESIGTLACGVAHDLNNILAGLSIAVDLLRSKETSAEMQEFLQALQGSTRRASEMIRQMLSFSKGIQGNTIQMNLGSLAKEISRICQATFPSTIRFRTKIAPDLWDVVGNATTLHQALLNLATNARDAMPQGGTLSISLENTELDEAFAHGESGIKPGSFVRLQVQDTGTGIPIDLLDRIFDPFFTTKGPEKGSGLGLTMVQKTVREHGGIIRCESQPGQGTCFSIYLPACVAESKTVAGHEPSTVFVGHGQTVLLVDADPPTRNLLKVVLEMFNLRVCIAGDGVEALTAFTESPEAIWAVISEMRLQHIDGLQLIRAIHSIAPWVPVVALIDSGDSARQADLDTLNVRRFLHKPFTAEDVAAVLTTIPEQHHGASPNSQLSLGFLSILPKPTS